MISILHLFNLNDLVISVILISKIEETNILIENPKTKKTKKRIKSKSIQFNWQLGLRILK